MLAIFGNILEGQISASRATILTNIYGMGLTIGVMPYRTPLPKYRGTSMYARCSSISARIH